MRRRQEGHSRSLKGQRHTSITKRSQNYEFTTQADVNKNKVRAHQRRRRLPRRWSAVFTQVAPTLASLAHEFLTWVDETHRNTSLFSSLGLWVLRCCLPKTLPFLRLCSTATACTLSQSFIRVLRLCPLGSFNIYRKSLHWSFFPSLRPNFLLFRWGPLPHHKLFVTLRNRRWILPSFFWFPQDVLRGLSNIANTPSSSLFMVSFKLLCHVVLFSLTIMTASPLPPTSLWFFDNSTRLVPFSQEIWLSPSVPLCSVHHPFCLWPRGRFLWHAFLPKVILFLLVTTDEEKDGDIWPMVSSVRGDRKRNSDELLWPFVNSFSNCHRAGAHISRILGHVMSLFGVQREFNCVFQCVHLFVTRFGGRVDRVWTSVKQEFCIAWKSVPYAKRDLAVGYDCSCHRRIAHCNHDDDSHYVKHCGEEHKLNFGVLMIQNMNEYCIETAACIGSRSPQSHELTNNVSWCSYVVSWYRGWSLCGRRLTSIFCAQRWKRTKSHGSRVRVSFFVHSTRFAEKVDHVNVSFWFCRTAWSWILRIYSKQIMSTLSCLANSRRNVIAAPSSHVVRRVGAESRSPPWNKRSSKQLKQ